MRFTRRDEPMATFEHANKLAVRGKTARAAALYQKAIDSGHPRAAAEAGIKLGIMRRRAGEYAAAERAYRAALDSGHPDLAPVAAFMLAGVLSDGGRHGEAADAYQYVIDSGHDLMPQATRNLAELIHYDLPENERDLARAAELYQRAIDTNDPDAAPKAMFGQAQLLLDDDPAAAAELYRRVIATGHPKAAPLARRRLRELQEDRGEPVDPPGSPGLRPAAGDSGCHLVLDGDGAVEGLWFEDATAGYQHAIDRGRITGILVANRLADLLDATYYGGADGTRGGYLITFRREV